MKKNILLPVLFHFCFATFSQNITGRWIGRCYYPESKGDTSLVFLDIQHDTTTNRITGTSITITGDFYGKSRLLGTYYINPKRFVLTETEVVETNHPVRNMVFPERYTLALDKNAADVFLYGVAVCDSTESERKKGNSPCVYKRTIILFRSAVSLPMMCDKKGIGK